MFGTRLIGALLSGALAGGLLAQAPTTRPAAPAKPRFEAATPLMIDGTKISVEQPGYAAPCIADVTGDGVPDLLVGQFAGGKIKLYPGKKKGGYEAGRWLEADGAVAEVPGVW